MMRIRLSVCVMIALVGTSSFAQTAIPGLGSSGIPLQGGASQRVEVRRLDSVLLVNIGEAAKALGWEAKVVVPGKLLTLCRSGEGGVCLPIRLDRVAFRATSGGMYVEAAAIERALQIEFEDIKSDSAAIVPAVALAINDDEIPAYNAAWGPGRGFRDGQTLPDIPLMDLDGREVRFSEFLGKRYIIYCWASW